MPKKAKKSYRKKPAWSPFSTSPTGAERKPTHGGTPPKGRGLSNTPPGPSRMKNPAITRYEDQSWRYTPKAKAKRRRKR